MVIDNGSSIRSRTALDVAKRAGVSVSAVSRAFTPGTSIATETKARVLQAAEELGYQPNLLARSLSTQRSGVVALVMGDMRNPYYPEVIDDLTRRFHASGLRTMLFSVWGTIGIDDAASSLVQSRVDGVVIASLPEADRLGEICFQAGAAVVLFNRTPNTSENLSSVRCDNVEGGRTVANFLLDKGYSRPAFIAGVEHISTTQERELGFRGRLRERGYDILAREIGYYTYRGGFAAAEKLAARREPPDAIFCANDIMALGCLDALRNSAKLRVPEDIAVVGFDDIEAASWPSYGLTTVGHDKGSLVGEAASIIVEQIRSGARRRHVRLIPVEVICRGTA